MKDKLRLLANKKSVRIDPSVAAIKQALLDNLTYIQGKFSRIATTHDYYMALSYTIRDHLMAFWTKTVETYFAKASRTVCYLSAEFLIGPQLANNILNLNLYDNVKKALQELNIDINELYELEPEPGLGNGGLGRLAACYMDSLATLGIPTLGYGIRYEFGIFNQEIRDGWQVEATDKWLRFGNPWEIPRPEIAFDIKFGGFTENYIDEDGLQRVRWVPNHIVKSIAYDMPIIGYHVNNANLLRLWKAEACESFDFQAFNTGDYYGAVQEKVASENLTKVLYPNDEPLAGKKLRLQQQYFFVASSLQDMIRIYKQREPNLNHFNEKYAIQLNDTHPSIAIPELMRILVDENKIDWEKAWSITQKTFGYTNHTILPEALEKWSIALFQSLLPRHLEIIYEINRRFLAKISSRFPNNADLIRRISLIDETGERSVRMAHLACIGSHAINGVSGLHTELLKTTVLKDFYDLAPEKFSNKTNGITPRRFLLLINPKLAMLITKVIGPEWTKNLEKLHALETVAENKSFQENWQKIKLHNKNKLAEIIKERLDLSVNPESIFDIQAKRLHEYKRQHLNILHVITLYYRLLQNPNLDFTPRTVIFAGKAAPGYIKAKLIIKLINSVAEKINHHPQIKDLLKVVFLPNYNVKNAQLIYPAADLSEQISTAGKEASGTGNMKFSLNGALTIGTLDGANVEIRNEVGRENFFLFGLHTEEIEKIKKEGYNPEKYITDDTELRAVIDLINSGHFSKNEPDLFRPITNELFQKDEYMLCADYRLYINCQNQISSIYRNQEQWTKMSILNVARMGKFSSDRAIYEYCQDIWKVEPVKIEDRK